MSSSGPCYYSVLGLSKIASASEIRGAYRQLALKWHPDRWMKDPAVAGEAKRRFQQIQEAYSVLSDKAKRKVYDAGLFSLLAEDDDEGFCDFMQELALMMESVSPKDRRYSMQDLHGLLMDMMGDEQRIQFEFDWDNSQNARKKTRLR